VKRPIVPTTAFLRSARRASAKNTAIEEAIRDALRLLELDAFDPQLKTHKLRGNLSGSWAARAGYDLRIIFQFRKVSAGEQIVLLAVGSHDEVY
jgi:mRNA-degrading endonuclease YafQ of YafQ-DinJ toxin-antitoxin module